MKLKFESTDFLHLLICMVCAFVVSAILAHTSTSPTPAIVGGWLAAMFLGVGKEFGDSRATGNAWSWRDFLFDFLGSSVGCWGGFLCYAIHV